MGTLTVSGKRDDLAGLSEKIIADLVAAMEKLPKPVSERPK